MDECSALIVWDFDYSLIPVNSDTWIFEQFGMPLTKEVRRSYEGQGILGWTAMMDHHLGIVCANAKLDLEDLSGRFADIPLEREQKETVLKLHAQGHTQMILSDANTLFIEWTLKHHGIDHCFAGGGIISNPAVWTGDRLAVTPFHCNDHCSLCPTNLCKGEALKAALAKQGPPPHSRLLYVGDGRGDVCPCTVYADATVLARHEYPLHCHFALVDNGNSHSRVFTWKNAAELQKHIEKTLL